LLELSKLSPEFGSGSDKVTVNQQQNGGQFNLLGTYALDQNSNITLTDAANGIVIGDAIQLIKQGTTPQSLYFIHGDHHGTPQVITDANQTIVWQAKYDPYGKATITTSSITNNLRFPGQYYDSETNLHYNYFRYYEPETGRYITSDPIGLSGGINTYGYVGGNPIKYIDPFGLRNFFIGGSFGIGGKTKRDNEIDLYKLSGGAFINIGDGNGNLITNDGKGNLNSLTLHLDAGLFGAAEKLELGGGATAGINVGCVDGDRRSFEDATTNINASIPFTPFSTSQIFELGTKVDLLSGDTDFVDKHIGQSYGFGIGGEGSETTQVTNSLAVGDIVRGASKLYDYIVND